MSAQVQSMDKVARLSAPELRELFKETASSMGLASAIVEKDFWVCWVLGRLFASPLQEKLLFKGGTSLSKVFNLIERFSEDIDLVLDIHAIGRELDLGPDESRNQRDKSAREVHRLTAEYLQTDLVPELRTLIGDVCTIMDVEGKAEGGGAYPKAVRVSYPAAFSGEYLRPEILLEISPLALWLPNGEYEISPMAAEQFPKLFDRPTCRVRAVRAERTFWEKATILHVLAHWPEGKPVPSRHSRHLYDMARMATNPVCDSALREIALLPEVADFKETWYSQSTAHYDLARHPGTLRLVPDTPILKELERDYSAMQSMLYGNRPSFSNIVTQLQQLETRIHELPDSTTTPTPKETP